MIKTTTETTNITNKSILNIYYAHTLVEYKDVIRHEPINKHVQYYILFGC